MPVSEKESKSHYPLQPLCAVKRCKQKKDFEAWHSHTNRICPFGLVYLVGLERSFNQRRNTSGE